MNIRGIWEANRSQETSTPTSPIWRPQYPTSPIWRPQYPDFPMKNSKEDRSHAPVDNRHMEGRSSMSSVNNRGKGGMSSVSSINSRGQVRNDLGVLGLYPRQSRNSLDVVGLTEACPDQFRFRRAMQGCICPRPDPVTR